MVVCRRSVPNTGYRLSIKPETGRFIVESLGKDRLRVLVDWQSSSAIRGSDTNHLELTCAGKTISAAINGIPVAAVEDDTYSEGRVWLGASAHGETVEVRFMNLLITQH